MKSILLAVLISSLVTVIFVARHEEQRNAGLYKIYFLPFDINTYGAVNESRIEQLACYIIDVHSSILDKLFFEIEKKNNRADIVDGYLDIRVKIKRNYDGRNVYITKHKQIVADNKFIMIPDKMVKAVVSAVIRYSKKHEPMPIYKDDPWCNLD